MDPLKHITIYMTAFSCTKNKLPLASCAHATDYTSVTSLTDFLTRFAYVPSCAFHLPIYRLNANGLFQHYTKYKFKYAIIHILGSWDGTETSNTNL